MSSLMWFLPMALLGAAVILGSPSRAAAASPDGDIRVGPDTVLAADAPSHGGDESLFGEVAQVADVAMTPTPAR